MIKQKHIQGLTILQDHFKVVERGLKKLNVFSVYSYLPLIPHFRAGLGVEVSKSKFTKEFTSFIDHLTQNYFFCARLDVVHLGYPFDHIISF